MSPFVPVNPPLHWHADSAVLPESETEFAGQAEQLIVPVADLYVQPGHCIHVPPSGPVDPMLHLHADSAVLAASEFEFAGHTTQFVVPGANLYVPTVHCVQGPPLLPVHPALQIHAVTTVLLMGDNVFDGHKVQTPSAEYELTAQEGHGPPSGPGNPALQIQSVICALFVYIESERGGQGIQLELPVTDLYVAPAHDLQFQPPSGPVEPA